MGSPIPDLNMRDKLEYRKLTRRFGNQPANFSQAKKQKLNELIDDAENDPWDRSPKRGIPLKIENRPSWDHRVKKDVSLP